MAPITTHLHRLKNEPLALLVQRAQEIAEAEAEFSECYRQRGEELLHWIRRAETAEAALTARAQEWRCFHCGETFTTVGAARDHFGATPENVAGCLIDRVALEEGGQPERGRGLLMALRKAEAHLTARAQEIEQVKAENERVRAALAEVPAPAKTTRQVIHERRAGIYAVIASLTTQEQRDAWGVSEDRPLYLNLTRVIDNLQKAADAALVSRAPQPEQEPMGDREFLHPVPQVYFRAGLLACREYMARFVEAESPTIAQSIRANWWPVLGPDFGPPRKLAFTEVTAGTFGAEDFRVRSADEVSPTQEALPIALGFLQSAACTPGAPGLEAAAPLPASAALQVLIASLPRYEVSMKVYGPDQPAHVEHDVEVVRCDDLAAALRGIEAPQPDEDKSS